LQADPCGVRVDSVYLKEPIPVLREIRPCWIGNAYSIGLSDTSNDYPHRCNGFFSNSFLTASVEVASKV
jgi:hypothetical protein